MTPAPGDLVDTPAGLAAVTAVNKHAESPRPARGERISAIDDDGDPVLGRWLIDIHPAGEVAA